MNANTNQYNNAKNVINVNTKGVQFMNSEGHFKSTLILGYWNELISLKFHPMLPENMVSDSKKFNYNEVMSTALTLEKATILLNAIKKEIIPDFGTKEIFKGVSIGSASLIGVGVTKKENEYIPYIALFKELDESTKKPSSFMYYEFRKSYTINDYNPGDGSYTMTQNIPSELMLFEYCLRAAIVGLTNATTHSVRHVDKWYRDKVANTIDALASKFGLSTRQNNFQRKNDVFSNTQSPAEGLNFDEPMAEIKTAENINELNDFM